jgi:hypothetical protein
MQQLQLTFGRALKFWWSLTWRSALLLLPISIVLNILMMASLMPAMPQPGEVPDPGQITEVLAVMIPSFVVGGLLSIVAMVYATRWTLRTRWRDFRIVLIAPEQAAAGSA